MELEPKLILRRTPQHEIASAADGVVLARVRSSVRSFAASEADYDELARVLEHVDGQRTVEDIVDALSDDWDGTNARAMLAELAAAGWIEPASSPAPRADVRPRIGVVGDGPLARRIAAHIELSGNSICDFVDPVSLPGSAHRTVICALEGVPLASVIAVDVACRAAGIACLFATLESGRAIVGPLSVPGYDATFARVRCALIANDTGRPAATFAPALPQLHCQLVDEHSADDLALVARAAGRVAQVLRSLFDPDARAELVDGCVVLSANGERAVRWLPKSCDEARSEDNRSVEVDIVVARHATQSPRAPGPMPTTISSVGVIGGDIAGVLAALALRRKLPHLRVALLASSKIPIDGVPEATTARLLHFLHDYVGLDVVELYRTVKPTWTLGTRFEWGLPGNYYFNSPFELGKLLEAQIYDGDINRSCLASRLMTKNRAPILRMPGGNLRSLLPHVPLAYHLGNASFVRYLKEQAIRAGVELIDVTIDGVERSGDDTVSHVVDTDGRAWSFELYVDCTGSRSLLLGKTLGTRFIDYASSLWTDRAVVADVPHRGLVRPYTVAATMDAGWCWSIPMRDCDHRGYVYASSAISDNDAVTEMRAKNPGMGEHRFVHFRSGRHEQLWRGNVVAIGDSYAFVEPLQSTAIHMAITTIERMIECFPERADLRTFQPMINASTAEVWDHLRYFLAAHYRFNRKVDTPFWRECRTSADISGVQRYVDLFRERAPIGNRLPRFCELDDSTFGMFRHDLLFMGQGLETTYVEPAESKDSWRQISAAIDRVVERALPHGEALTALTDHPEILVRHAEALAHA